MVVSHVGSCWNQERDLPDLFTSEPGVPQGEEGVASRASRQENPEALVFLLHSSHLFIQSSVLREGVSWESSPPLAPSQGCEQGTTMAVPRGYERDEQIRSVSGRADPEQGPP